LTAEPDTTLAAHDAREAGESAHETEDEAACRTQEHATRLQRET